MELSKQAPVPGTVAAASRPSPSMSPQSAQPAGHRTLHPDNWGARVPNSEYLIMPMSGPAGAPKPSAAHLPELGPTSSVPLRPPLQVVNVQKELLPKPHPEPSESVRAKFMESLAAALGLNSDHLCERRSASDVSPFESAGESKHAGDIVVGASESASKLNSERDLASDIDAGATVSLSEPESKRVKLSDEGTGEKKGVIQNVQILTFRIEEEMFKLFGGVNKRYKEKARSLLFNLKDKNNPALRKRVLSGDITPKFLCSMTTEELASKELSAWRLAKSEELAKMVVLPDREVDIRRLVRKTHKGEFRVEVEESDGMSVDVELGGDSLSHLSESIESQTKSENRRNLHRGDKESDNSLGDGVGGKGNSNLQRNLEECPANEMTDPLQEFMVENLPGIISLDRCTEVRGSKLYYEGHSTVAVEDVFPNNKDITLEQVKVCITEDKAAQSEFELKCNASSSQDIHQLKSKSPKNISVPALCQAKHMGDRLIKSYPETMAAEKLDASYGSVSIPGRTVQPNRTPDAALIHGSLWEGTIQFYQSSFTRVVAIFKSGEKLSTNNWRCFVEIKGRVKLTDFQEFLKQLPNSRRRAVMVTELRWKEDSTESGRQHLQQTIDSYIADERVGVMKLAEGVELYLCPSHGKASQILAKHLPEEHSGSLTVTGEASAIGVVVWKRPHDSTRIPTRHDGSNVLPMSISRKQRTVITSSMPTPSHLTKPPGSRFIHSNEHHHINDDDDDASNAILPGFGQCGVKHADDIPEYDFVGVSNNSVNVEPSHTSRSQQHVPKISQPPDQKRQLVHKYGDRYVSAQPSGGEDDHIRTPDRVRQLVHKYGNRYVSDQPSDGDDDHLHRPEQGRQLVRKYGNSYVSTQAWGGDDDDFWPPDQVRQLIHRYDSRYVSAQPWDGNDVDFWPPDQVRQLIRKYGNRYSTQPWDCRDDLPDLYWDPIQSGHQQTWHPHPLMPLSEHDQQTEHYYHPRDRQLEEHYFGPEQHLMTMQPRQHYQSVMHPADKTHGWRSRTHAALLFHGWSGEREPWLGPWDWEAQHYVRERF